MRVHLTAGAGKEFAIKTRHGKYQKRTKKPQVGAVKEVCKSKKKKPHLSKGFDEVYKLN